LLHSGSPFSEPKATKEMEKGEREGEEPGKAWAEVLGE
jgi:hypothetical protein